MFINISIDVNNIIFMHSHMFYPKSIDVYPISPVLLPFSEIVYIIAMHMATVSAG